MVYCHSCKITGRNRPENCQSSVLSYILETRERLKECTELAKKRENVGNVKQKVYFDRKARQRQFEVGDKALFLPSNTSKLLAQWNGPFEFTEKVGSVDYKVRVKRKKLFFLFTCLRNGLIGRRQ